MDRNLNHTEKTTSTIYSDRSPGTSQKEWKYISATGCNKLLVNLNNIVKSWKDIPMMMLMSPEMPRLQNNNL